MAGDVKTKLVVVVTSDTAKLKKGMETVESSTKKVEKRMKGAKASTESLASAFLKANIATEILKGGFNLVITGIRNIINAVQSGIGAVASFFQRAIDYTTDFNKEMAVFKIIAKNTKSDVKEWSAAAVELAGYLGATNDEVTNLLTPLMKNNVAVKDAIALIKGFANEQTTAADSTLTAMEKIENLVQMYNLEMSALGNRAGLEENVSNMIQLGYKIMDQGDSVYKREIKRIEKEGKARKLSSAQIKKNVAAYKENARQQAKTIGFLATMEKSQGAYMATLTGTERIERLLLKTNSQMLLTIGTPLVAAIQSLAGFAFPFLEKALGGVNTAINNFVARATTWWQTSQTKIQPIIEKISKALGVATGSFTDFTSGLFTNQAQFNIWADAIFNSVVGTLTEMWNKFKGFTAWLKSPAAIQAWESFKNEVNDSRIAFGEFIAWLKSDEGKQAIATFSQAVIDLGRAFLLIKSSIEWLIKNIGGIAKIADVFSKLLPGLYIAKAAAGIGDLMQGGGGSPKSNKGGSKSGGNTINSNVNVNFSSGTTKTGDAMRASGLIQKTAKKTTLFNTAL